MNINDFWVEKEEVPRLNMGIVLFMIDFRRKIADGFYQLEYEKGHYPKNPSLSLPKGQDYARLTAFRVLEEISESFDSQDRAHKMEELIDAINYLLNLLMFDDSIVDRFEANELLYEACSFGIWDTHLLDLESLGRITVSLSGHLADTFRNRSWMNNSQANSYQGKDILTGVFLGTMGLLLSEFESWEEFYQYYIAKNEVLRFRLKSEY